MRKRPKNANPPPVSLGGIVREELPLPFVHYPSHYGSFIAFSETSTSQPYLCECSLPAVINFFELRKSKIDISSTYQKDTGNHLDQLNLPDSIVNLVMQNKNELNHGIKFRRAICHRCNMIPPSLRFCHEMYGVTFIQYFGYYVQQAYLKLGILPNSYIYLAKLTPAEYIKDIELIEQSRLELANAMKSIEAYAEQNRINLNDKSNNTSSEEYSVQLHAYQENIRVAQLKDRQSERVLSKKIENIVREEFGFKKVGERWTSETLLFQIVSNLISEKEIIRHHRPGWLEGLELDIYIPELQVGIEYQGQQHFHPIKAWGGEKALSNLQDRDKKKTVLCKQNGVKLITIDYTEPLTIDYVRGKLR